MLADCICFKYSYLISNAKLSRALKIRIYMCSLYMFWTVKIKYVYHVIYLLTCDKVKHSYSKFSNSSNFYHSLFSNKVLPIRTGIHKIFIRIPSSSGGSASWRCLILACIVLQHYSRNKCIAWLKIFKPGLSRYKTNVLTTEPKS